MPKGKGYEKGNKEAQKKTMHSNASAETQKKMPKKSTLHSRNLTYSGKFCIL